MNGTLNIPLCKNSLYLEKRNTTSQSRSVSYGTKTMKRVKHGVTLTLAVQFVADVIKLQVKLANFWDIEDRSNIKCTTIEKVLTAHKNSTTGGIIAKRQSNPGTYMFIFIIFYDH